MNPNKSSSPNVSAAERRRTKATLAGLFGLLLMVAMIPVGVIAFDAPTSPPAMVSMARSLDRINVGDVPAPRQFRARDGASLQYYVYPAAPDRVAVLVHGSAGPGTSMHVLAEALRAAGLTAYVLDIRGHGGSGRRGDIDYIGQIDDDLSDFVAQLGPAGSGETRTLVGFSAGAGFSIRFAGGPYGLLFDRYVFLAPIPTASYSYRLSVNFGGRGYETYLKNIRRPAAVLVGDADEQVVADQFAPLLQRLGVNIPVTIVPDMKHADMIAGRGLIRRCRFCSKVRTTISAIGPKSAA